MATFVVTADTNIDSLTSKAGQDTYNINGGKLRIDQHSRYGQNANTSATLGPVTTSATLGGDLIIDGRKVRLIAFDTGAGTVPAYNTTISQGGASGLLIGVYSALNVAPTAPAAAMPASGYILIKQWNDVAYTAAALTGISANATAADRVGWIEVVGNAVAGSTGACTLNGIGNATTPVVQGLPFEIGTTPGTPARTDTYQIPTNGDACYMPGVYVETAAASGVYDFWPTTTSSALLAEIATDSRRGRFCWVSTGGVLRFGHDGVNSTGGALPPAGCRIVTGNVFMTQATAGAPTVNVLPAAVADRYRFAGTSLGRLNMEWATMLWSLAIVTYAECNWTYVSNAGQASVTQTGTPMIWDRVGIGTPAAITGRGTDLVQLSYGGTFTDCVFSAGVYGASSRPALRLYLSNNVTLLRCRTLHSGARSSTSNYAVDCVTSNTIEFDSCVFDGTMNLTGNNYRIHDNEYWFDHATWVSAATNITTLWVSTATDVIIENELFPIAGQVPRGGLSIFTNGEDCTVRNIGSIASPIEFGDYEEDTAAWTRVTTTATVTTAANHNLVTGDTIWVYRSSAISAITAQSLKTVTVTGATTFTFTCLNASAASGTLGFFHTVQGTVVHNIQATNSTRIKYQNVHATFTSLQSFVGNATSVDAQIENVTHDPRYRFFPQVIGTNTQVRSISTSLAGPIVASATLGTHWLDQVHPWVEGKDMTGATWTRASGVFTVTTATPHNLLTSDVIQVYNSSAPTGATESNHTVTAALTDTTFTFSGTAAGAASGTLSYRVSSGTIGIQMNGPAAGSTTAEVTAGTPAFTGAGSLAAFTVGDQVTWTTPDWILGHDTFMVAWPRMGGATDLNRSYDQDYQIDTGSGYSGWRNGGVFRTAGAGTAAAFTITVNSTTGIAAGDYVFMQRGVDGVGPDAKVVTVDNATQLTLDVANDTTFSGATLLFSQLPSEAAFPATGIKLKWRATCITGGTTAITNIQIPTNTTTTSRARLYPQTTAAPLSITAVDQDLAPVENARVYIEAGAGGPETSGTVLLTGLTDASGVLTGTYGYSADQPITGWVRRATGTPKYKQALVGGDIEDTGFSTTVFLVEDE